MSISVTTLSQQINGYQTQFSIASTANVVVPYYSSGSSSYLYCEQEAMEVTAVPISGVVRVRRGVLGTSAAAHATNTAVVVGLAADLPLMQTNNNVANLSLLAQTASIPTTVLYSVPFNKGGMYAVYLDIICTTAGTGGTVSASINWNNGTTSAGLATATFSLATQAEQTVLYDNFVSAPSQNITYATTVSGATGSPQYSLGIRLQYLG